MARSSRMYRRPSLPRVETKTRRSPRAAKAPDKVLQYVLSSPWAISEAGLHRVLAIASRLTISPQALEGRSGQPLDNTRTTTVRGGVATIPVEGPLVKRAPWLQAISGACDYVTISKDLRAALDDTSVSAVILAIDSPGGEVSGCSELAQMILAGRENKPIYAYVSGECCSAAYWLASATSGIYAADTALVGNLGVLMTMVDDSRRMKAEGLERITIVSSQTPAKPHDVRTEPGRERVQALVDSLADVFLGAVAMGRSIPVDNVLTQYGAGRVFVGAGAVEAGLADEITTYEALMASIAAESGATSPLEELSMPARTPKGRAQAKRAPAKATAAAKSMAKSKPAPAAEEMDREDEMADDGEEEEPTAGGTSEEEPTASDDTADDEEPVAEGDDDEENGDAPVSSKKAKARLSLQAATAERTRIVSILGYAERFGLSALMPFINDPTCTKAKAAEQLLEHPPTARTSRLQALKGDEAQLRTVPVRSGSVAAAGKTGTRLLSALARVNPAALPDSAKAAITSSN